MNGSSGGHYTKLTGNYCIVSASMRMKDSLMNCLEVTVVENVKNGTFAPKIT